VNAVWVLERAAAAAPPRLIRPGKISTAPRWSADGVGSTFFPRVPARRSFGGPPRAAPIPENDEPAARCRVLPARAECAAAVVAVNAHPTRYIACSKAKDDAKAKEKTTGVLYDSTTRGFGIPTSTAIHRAVRAQSQRRCAATDGAALTAATSRHRLQTDGDDSSFAISTDGASVFFAAAHPDPRRGWVMRTVSTAYRWMRAQRRAGSILPRRLMTAGLLFLPTDRGWLIFPGRARYSPRRAPAS